MKTLPMMMLTLVGSAAACGAEPAGHKMEGMNMPSPASQAAVNRTTGVIKALDVGSVTLAHEAVPSLKWPGMTMAFKITPEQAKGLKVGQKVEFEFTASGMDGTITKIKPVP